jgi:hypothetical protein
VTREQQIKCIEENCEAFKKMVLANPVVSGGKIKAQFLEPMESLPVSKLPEGEMWTSESSSMGGAWRL